MFSLIFPARQDLGKPPTAGLDVQLFQMVGPRRAGAYRLSQAPNLAHVVIIVFEIVVGIERYAAVIGGYEVL